MNVMEIMGADLARLIEMSKVELKTVPYVFNVKGYGAQGNGQNDDIQAIQDAVDAASAIGGGQVFLPNGTYLVSKKIVMKPGVTLNGSSMNATIIKLKDNSNTSVIEAVSANHVEIWNLTVNANKANQTAGHGIFMHTVDAVVSDVKVIDSKEQGIVAWENVTGNITRCIVTGAGKCGIRSVFGNSSLSITECDVSYCFESGILLENAKGSQIHNCKTHHNTADGENSNGISIQSDEVRVISCESYSNFNAGIYSTNSKTTVIGCHSHHNMLGYDIYAGSAKRTDFVTIGNTFKYNSSKGHSAYWADNIISSGNIISDNTDHGVEFDSCQHVIFTENEVYFNSQYGVNVRSSVPTFKCNDMLITSNDLSRNGSGAVRLEAGNDRYIHAKGNVGQSPIGYIGSPPAMPATGVQLVNPYGYDIRLFITGGTVSAIKINGNTVGITSGMVYLAATEAISIDYSAAPTWRWFGM